ncbi:receptor-like serine/threonine-protein kinase SD1-8 isoform X2 [Argentina anserina]|uniref:receptor-like serine/threonine-protein kinase SD1-8 isoform X2 n=1 Tax=Argentina anserina TaxID=57926 RepID=UPI002176552B|nr:receptor-like serine/threonine-protein kinase SD1-8 isoform X2 [Potentilla anserina]
MRGSFGRTVLKYSNGVLECKFQLPFEKLAQFEQSFMSDVVWPATQMKNPEPLLSFLSQRLDFRSNWPLFYIWASFSPDKESFWLHGLRQSRNDTLTPSDTLTDSQTLVSAGGVFVLGLFNKSSSGYYYLGIWLKADADKVVWVERDNPMIDSSTQLQIRSGNLVLTDRRQVPLIINSGNLATNTTNTSATLLDTGNFVLKEAATGTTIWQSFDIPTDTYLPGMKIGLFGLNKTEKAGFHILVSWASPLNPTRGLFTLSVDVNDHTRILVWRGDGAKMNVAFWEGNGLRFIFQNSSSGNVYNFSFQSNESEAFYTFSTPKNYDLIWFVMASTGTLDHYSMFDGKISSVSHALCEDIDDGSSKRCLTSLPSMCENDGKFSVMNGLLPTNTSDGSIDIWSDDCETLCKNNCSCTAYTSRHNGQPGCQVYYGSRQNLLKIVEKGVGDIFIRSGASSDGKKWKLWLSIAGPLTSLLISISIFYWWYLRCRRKHKDQVTKRESDQARLFQLSSNNASPIQLDEVRSANNMKLGRQKDQDIPFFSFSAIKTATDHFAESNKLGEGGYGPVYKGKLLQERQEIAVKRLSKISRQGLEEFKNEVSLICKLQHRNLVRLLGCCIEAEESILIYEFMPNNSLDSFIFDSSKQVLLDWERRVNIIEGISQGLLYLHKYSRLRIIHRDLKTSNILLDCDMNPKISDFGMARIVGDDDIRGQTKRVVGTIGYMSPEYAMDGLFSEKSDVFSFGVIILEVISGKKNIAFFYVDQSQNLLSRAWNLWKDGNWLGLMDSALLDSCSSNEVMRYIQIGLLCVQERAIDRPYMSDVVFMLSNESIALPHPKEPAFLSHFSSDTDSSSSRQRYYSKNDVTMSQVDAR